MDKTPGPSAPPPVTGPLPDRELDRARTVARVLDDLVPIPGTSWRVGLDPLLGLVPGVGDWIGWAASLHLLVTAARAGADPSTLLRMSGNLLLDAVVGAFPVAGDLFDTAWKANHRNLQLLEAAVLDPDRTRRTSRWVVGSIIGGTVGLLGAASVGALILLRWVAGAVAGLF